MNIHYLEMWKSHNMLSHIIIEIGGKNMLKVWGALRMYILIILLLQSKKNQQYSARKNLQPEK